MIWEGIKLTIVGMGVVYLFLIVLLFTIKLIAEYSRNATSQEFAQLCYEQKLSAEKRKQQNLEQNSDNLLVAVSSAAIAFHRKKFA